MNRYGSILERLRDVRHKQDVTQIEAARLLDITQGQYSDIETDRIRLSHEILMKLRGAGWDVAYILTGHRQLPLNEQASLLCASASTERLLPFICLSLQTALETERSSVHTNMAEAAATAPAVQTDKCSAAQPDEHSAAAPTAKNAEGLLAPALVAALSNELQLMERLLFYKGRETPVYAARELLGISQLQLADIIGLGIKNYRLFERGTKYPDAEVLCALRNQTGCRETLFIGLGNECWDIAAYVWSHFTAEHQAKIVEMLRQNNDFLKAFPA